jgi:hypothetical protein
MKLDRFLALLESVSLSDFPKFDSPNTIDNLDRFRPLIVRLSQAEEFTEITTPILESEIFATDSDHFYGSETYSRISGPIRRLQLLIVELPKVLRIHASPPSEFTVSLKLPDPADLKDALNVVTQFEKALEQLLFNPAINGEIRLIGWEVGSFWIDLYLASALAVSVVGSVAWAAAVVRKKTLEGDLIEKKVQGLDIGNDALEALRDGLKKSVQTLTDAEALAILDKHYDKKNSGDQLERIKLSIKISADLIQRGAEVYPGLYAPEEVKNLFPEPAKLAAIVSKIQQLEDIDIGPSPNGHSA